MFLDTSWIKELWNFVCEKKIRLMNRITAIPLPQQEGNVFLMEIFQEEGYTQSQLEILNRCWKYLKVMMLADVMTGAGDSFTEHYLCICKPQPCNNFTWPQQEEPTTAIKKLWKKASRKLFGMRAGKTSYTLGK